MYNSSSPSPRPSRALLVAAALTALALLLVPVSRAQAAFHLCRTDPIVTLSNGDIVSIYVEIAADASEVSSIEYTLHVPEGVTAVSIVYLGTEQGLVEHLTVVQDGKDDEYKSETRVNISKKVEVTATTVFENESVTVTGKGQKTLKATIELDVDVASPDDE